MKYPKHRSQPDDLLDFVESRRFTADWKGLHLDDAALMALQIAIISDPTAPAVIEGTGGLRKLRFAPASWKSGKSGAARVCYVYFEECSVVYLLRAYAKNEKDDLTDMEKDHIKKAIMRLKEELSKKPLYFKKKRETH